MVEAKPVLESDMYWSISAKLQTVPLNVRSASNVPNMFLYLQLLDEYLEQNFRIPLALPELSIGCNN